MRKLTRKSGSAAFSDFAFKRGDLVEHLAGGVRGVILNRSLCETITGTTVNRYIVGTHAGQRDYFELELEAVPPEFAVATKRK